MSIQLSPDMFDAISEVFNIGVGHSAKSLRTMIQAPVSVSTPVVEILSETESRSEFNIAPEKFMIGTCTSFEGGFGGDAMLLLPSYSAINLSDAIVKFGPKTATPVPTQDIIEEVGNVMIVACFTKIADILGVRLSSTVPIYLAGMEDIRKRFRAQMADDVIWFRFQFSVNQLQVSGYIYLLMDPMHTFLHAVQSLIDKTFPASGSRSHDH